MNWFWLNIPLDAVFFLAITAIPLWVVIRHPDYRPAAADATGKAPAMQAGTDWPGVPAETCDRRELVGASDGDHS